MPGRGLQDPPVADLLHATRAQVLEALHFGLDVIRDEIEVQAARVGNALHLDVQAVFPGLERHITGVFLGGGGPQLATQRRCPEIGCAAQIVDLAVDDEAGKGTAVHAA